MGIGNRPAGAHNLPLRGPGATGAGRGPRRSGSDVAARPWTVPPAPPLRHRE